MTEVDVEDDGLSIAADSILDWITEVHAGHAERSRLLWRQLGTRLIWRIMRVFIFGWWGPRR